MVRFGHLNPPEKKFRAPSHKRERDPQPVAEAYCAAVGFGDGVESSNIVGYQQIDLAKGFSFFTATFKDCNQETIDIQKITSVQATGAAWKTSGSGSTKCAGNITIQKIGTNGAYLDEYLYYSTKTPQGWYDANGTYVAAGEVTLANGEGLVINNTHQVGAKLVVNGEVDLVPARVLPKGFSFCGNFTPVTIDLQDIMSTQADGTAWKTSGSGSTKCAGNITIQKIGTNGAYLDEYLYYSTKTPQGWYDATGTYVQAGTVNFVPGEGFVVNMTHQVGARLVLPNPVAE